MFRFADPLYFLAFLPLAVAAWYVYRPRARKGLIFSVASAFPYSGWTWRTLAALVLPAFTLLGLGAIVVALARPQTVFSKIHRTADVIAVEMAVDVSGSMEALDMSERTAVGIKYRSRLDAVKEAFASFVTKRPDDLIGLVTFGGFASSRAPLTSDHAALLHVLKGVEVPKGEHVTREETMTAIGDGLATACARLDKAAPKSRIVVLLTDGVSNADTIKPEEAMKLAKKMGVRVYTIGVGTNGGAAPFRVRDAFGRDVIQYIDVEFNDELLKTIARATNGRYFNVRDPNGLQNALDDIDKLEKTRVEKAVYNQYNELFPWFLLPGLALVAAGVTLNVLIAKRIV